MTRGPEAPRGARKRTQKTLNYEAEQQSRWFQRAVELNLAPLAAVAHDVIVRGVATNPALLRAARYADAHRGGKIGRIAFANRWGVLVAPVPRGANANALAPVAV